MQLVIKYFALFREVIGTSEEVIEVQDGTTVQNVREHVNRRAPELAPLLDRSMIMRNQEYVDSEQQLSDGDEIAVIPPVSGGSRCGHFSVHDRPLDTVAIAKNVDDPGAGASVVFTGVVRDNARGRRVVALEYEAYPAAAERQLARVGQEMSDRWPLLGIAIEHRTGRLAIGEASVVIAVTSAHRDAAFEASAYAIQRIKEIVPIWKKEFYVDEEAWIGSESDYQVMVAGERRANDSLDSGGNEDGFR